MADDTEDQAVHPADPAPQLVDFVNSFQNDDVRGVMTDAATRIQDYTIRRQIADENRAVANRVVTSLDEFRTGLASMANNDPASVSLGLDLAPDIVEGIIHSNPYLPGDQRARIASSITADVQREVARSGVMSLADQNADAAKRLLGSERVAALFSEQETAGLEGYIGAMDYARTMDSSALTQQRVKDNAATTNFSMVQHLSGLVDPKTGELAFPGGWAQRVMSDQAIPSAQTAGMLGLYDRLQKGGDVQSDPHVLAGLIDGISQGRVRDTASILSYVGESLSVGDAVGLAYSALNPTSMREMQALSATIGAARRSLAAPENGPAGAAAFGRFVEWLVPNYKAAGAGSLNPQSDNYLLPAGEIESARFWEHFSPRGDDVVVGMRPGGTASFSSPDRPTLQDIFGQRNEGGRVPRAAGDQVIRGTRTPIREREFESTPIPEMGNTPENPKFDAAGNPVYDNPKRRS